jgi:cytoplasmic iron level regulating protein YaaA (DUF328/UPF0246 family)
VDYSPRYLLILACSQRKHPEVGLLPAIERYDGGSYKTLRKAQREGNWPIGLDVLILSAKYGLIEASTLIPNYDQRMNSERAKELQAQTSQALQIYAQRNSYHQVYVDLGQDYYPAIGDLRSLFNGTSVVYAEGRIGERLSRLKQWLIRTCKVDTNFLKASP